MKRNPILLLVLLLGACKTPLPVNIENKSIDVNVKNSSDLIHPNSNVPFSAILKNGDPKITPSKGHAVLLSLIDANDDLTLNLFKHDEQGTIIGNPLHAFHIKRGANTLTIVINSTQTLSIDEVEISHNPSLAIYCGGYDYY